MAPLLDSEIAWAREAHEQEQVRRANAYPALVAALRAVRGVGKCRVLSDYIHSLDECQAIAWTALTAIGEDPDHE